MKSIVLKNESIVRVYNLLQGLELKGKASRGRTKFQKRLQEKEEEFIVEKQEMQKQYVQLDENGEFVILEDGVSSPLREDLTLEDKQKFLNLLEDINKETFEISFAEYASKFEAMFEALDNLEIELSGENADAYDELMDAYELNEEEK